MHKFKWKSFFIIIGILLFVWAFFIEPNLLTVKTLDINVKGLKGLKVVFVGDFHIKPNQKKNLIKLVHKINEQHPDLILTTGDFVSGHEKKQTLPIKEIAKELSKLKSKYGTYAVLGNHDWWQGGEEIEKELKKNNMVVLNNENTSIKIKGKKLYIVGVEDITTKNIDLVKSLKGASSPAILLTHSPDAFPFISNPSDFPITGKVDLTLAGHTHGGQVDIPFVGPLIVPSSYGQRYAQGLIEENGKKLFVTKGIGTSILPVRFNCLPEIVVINFN